MKKIMKKAPIITSILVIMIMVSTTIVNATSATSYTRTFDAKNRLVRTQDAYLPDRTISELKLNKPADLFIDQEDHLYIVDTDNKRVLKYDTGKDQVLMELSYDGFITPKGIYVTENKEIYIADPGAASIFHFSKDGQLLETFGKPDSPSFGNNDFKPMKVAVDKAGNMYVLGEGIYDGIIQLAFTGEFLGYFTSNRVSLSWVERLQDLFFTEQQKSNLLGRTPVTFSNVFANTKGIVYTTTMGKRTMQPIAKHNTAGQNMLTGGIVASSSMLDIYVDAKGIIYAIDKEGLIFVFTIDGEFIYLFGSYDADQDVSGLFSSLAAIAVDSQGTIWTIDNEKSFIQSFVPTEYANMIYDALAAFNAGNYQAAIEVWDNILKLNQMSILAHNNVGKNYLSEQKYEKAMHHTKIAGNRFYYSQSFWEVRNIWLQRNLAYILSIILLLYFLSKIVKWADKKGHILNPIKKVIRKIYEIKPIKDTLFLFKVLRHPIDSFYDLKIGKRGSYLGALLIYFGVFIAYLWSLVGKGFIYQLVAPEDVDFQSIALGYFAITLLFVLCNYLVTSIKDGEGSLGQIFKLLSYAMGPLLISLLIITMSSHYLTFNEMFLIQMISTTGLVWSGVNILIGVQEVHTYDTKDAIKSIFITLSFMIIIAIVLVIVIIMSEQLFQFLQAIVKEVIRNVFS